MSKVILNFIPRPPHCKTHCFYISECPDTCAGHRPPEEKITDMPERRHCQGCTEYRPVNYRHAHGTGVCRYDADMVCPKIYPTVKAE